MFFRFLELLHDGYPCVRGRLRFERMKIWWLGTAGSFEFLCKTLGDSWELMGYVLAFLCIYILQFLPVHIQFWLR